MKGMRDGGPMKSSRARKGGRAITQSDYRLAGEGMARDVHNDVRTIDPAFEMWWRLQEYSPAFDMVQGIVRQAFIAGWRRGGK